MLRRLLAVLLLVSGYSLAASTYAPLPSTVTPFGDAWVQAAGSIPLSTGQALLDTDSTQANSALDYKFSYNGTVYTVSFTPGEPTALSFLNAFYGATCKTLAVELCGRMKKPDSTDKHPNTGTSLDRYYDDYTSPPPIVLPDQATANNITPEEHYYGGCTVGAITWSFYGLSYIEDGIYYKGVIYRRDDQPNSKHYLSNVRGDGDFYTAPNDFFLGICPKPTIRQWESGSYPARHNPTDQNNPIPSQSHNDVAKGILIAYIEAQADYERFLPLQFQPLTFTNFDKTPPSNSTGTTSENGGGLTPGSGSGGTTPTTTPTDSGSNCSILDIPCNLRYLFIPKPDFFKNLLNMPNVTQKLSLPVIVSDYWEFDILGKHVKFAWNDIVIPESVKTFIISMLWLRQGFWVMSYLGMPLPFGRSAPGGTDVVSSGVQYGMARRSKAISNLRNSEENVW